ncbi:RidA family protein [Paenarthrobacter sp. NPDC056912]|uniref:RidA family protein n=1 Tax=Paenarthrobacter sp. NPDC056912 TaxID=3345965 RepID=UPI00366CE2EC
MSSTAFPRSTARIPSPWEQRLAELNYTLPEAAKPAGIYVPAVRTGNLVYTSGQLPMVQGVIERPGKVGSEVSVSDAKLAAEHCVLNALAAIDNLVGLDSVVRVVKVVGFVASSSDFTGQPEVVNGASKLLADVLGDAGVHARSAVGVAALPLNACVEIELVVEVA